MINKELSAQLYLRIEIFYRSLRIVFNGTMYKVKLSRFMYLLLYDKTMFATCTERAFNHSIRIAIQLFFSNDHLYYVNNPSSTREILKITSKNETKPRDIQSNYININILI